MSVVILASPFAQTACGHCGELVQGRSMHVRCAEIVEDARAVVPALRVIRSDMTCGTCGLRLWDCPCPASAECGHCGLDPDDAAFINPNRCEDSPSGKHYWLTPEDRA